VSCASTSWPADSRDLLARTGRRLVLLTVFRKTRSAETADVARAVRAQQTCERSHGIAHDSFDRNGDTL